MPSGTGIERGIYPGAVVIIGRRDSLLYARGYGHFTWSPSSPVPTSRLYALGPRLDHQDRLDHERRDAAGGSGQARSSCAGRAVSAALLRRPQEAGDGADAPGPHQRSEELHPHLPEGAEDDGQGDRYPLRSAAAPPPGDSAVYSDLNAILLGLVVEKVAGTSIDRFAAREIFQPLGMRETMFKPPKKLLKRIVPTGIWRGQPVAGEVNDQNAVAFGGVAGHAGLFSTGADLARYAQVWLRGGMGPDGPLGPVRRRWLDSSSAGPTPARASWAGIRASESTVSPASSAT